jgi:hypothetical protein
LPEKRNVHKFRLLPKSIDDFADYFPPNTKPRKNASHFQANRRTDALGIGCP